MTNTNVVAVSPSVNGNIGSCEVNATDIFVNSFQAHTISVNSCDGRILSDSPIYISWGSVIFAGVIIIMVLAVASGVFISIFGKNNY